MAIEEEGTGKTILSTRWKYAFVNEEEIENATKAAAAPEMLSALQTLLSLNPCSMSFNDEGEADRYFKAIARAEMAIAKAITLIDHKISTYGTPT